VFLPASRLQENARYQWDVVAVDEVGSESVPSERWSFVVDLENEAPSEPILISPEQGATVNEARPLFQAGGSVDQEGAQLSYHFEVRAVGEMSPLAVTSAEGVIAQGGVAEWTPDVDLNEDQEHVVSVFASDGVSQTGMITGQFYVSVEDNPPPKPTLLEPNDSALLAPSDAVLIWSDERDPERGNVRYQVEYCDPAGSCQESELLNSNAFSLEGLIPTQVIYSWSARSLDDAGNSLGYSNPRYLTLTSGGSEAGASTEGCSQVSGRTSSHVLALLITLLLTRVWWMRRRLG
jgi:hypothetical protein